MYAAESGRTEMILARVDMESGLMTDVAQLPQFEPQIGEPFFRVPNAGKVPSLVLGSLGQYRIDVPAGRVVQDDGIGGGYSYRRGVSAEELLFRDTLLDSGRAIPELAVSPDQSRIVWQARPHKGPSRGAYTSEIRVHDAASGETRTVATEGIPGGWDERHRSFEGNLLWISTQDLKPGSPANPLPWWKRFSHKPHVGDTPALVMAGESPAAASADTLEPLRERLQKEVGGQWRVWTSRAGFTRRPAISATLPTWFNVTVPYLIAPATKDDEVGKSPKDYEGSIALEVIATDNRYTVCAGPSYEPEVATQVLSIAGLTLSKEAEQHRLRHSAADWLDFRLAVTEQSGAAGSKSVPLANGPSLTQIEDYTKLFAEKGPNAGRQRGDPYVWFPRLDCCEVRPPLVTTSNRRAPYDRPHVLLSDKPEQVLLCGSKRPRPWSLKRVQAGEDAAGQPVVVMELDAVAAEHMAKLTSSNPGCALAVLFNNSVVQVIVLESKLSDRVVLSGKAFDKALVARIVRSLSECMMEQRGTTEKPTRTDAQD